MKWVAVDAMRLKPYKCIGCGGTPRDDAVEGRPNMQAYFCEGVDYDWGKSLYLCGNCVRVLGLLRGMVDVGEHEKVKKALTNLQNRYDQLDEENKRQEERIERMLDGVKAKKEIESTRPKKKVKASA
jgi:hypothetical protein